MSKEEKQKLREGLADMAQKVESDHEVQMARSDLYKTAKYSIKLHEMLKNVSEAEGLDGWVAAKITKAADYLGSVYHHLDYQMKYEEASIGEGKKKDQDGDGDIDSDDYMKAKDKAIKKAMSKKDESVFVAYKNTLASQLSKKLGE